MATLHESNHKCHRQHRKQRHTQQYYRTEATSQGCCRRLLSQEQTNLKQRTSRHSFVYSLDAGAGGDSKAGWPHHSLLSNAQTISQNQKQKQRRGRREQTVDRILDASNRFALPSFRRPNLSGNALNWRIDSSLCFMIMWFIFATAVISGNAVFAAQRDSLRAKDTKGLSNNANVIPNGAAIGDGNAVNSIGADTNTINSGNAVASIPAASSMNQTQSTIAAAAITTTTTTSTTTTTDSSALSSLGLGSLMVSGSLQKGGNTAGINRNAIDPLDDARSGPYFDKSSSKNVTALLGKTAYLNCRVKNLGNKTMLLQVSWVRHRDIHLLTVGRYTYTSDQRFRALHQPQTEDWILQIKYPQHRDSGIYECQVSTTPHMSHYIHLSVVEPSTEIIGAPDLYIESGSTINLTCVIRNSPEPPAYIFWNHNNAIINYDSPRGGVSVVTNKGETTTSFLLIKSARPTDSGLYQCNPSNSKLKSVTVHVLNGEFPAAMQRAGLAHHRMSQSHYILVYLSLCLFTLAYVKRYMKLLPQSSRSQTLLSSQKAKFDGQIQESSQAVHSL